MEERGEMASWEISFSMRNMIPDHESDRNISGIVVEVRTAI